jgi:LPXTG-motif cell wall-anchored protein
VTGLTNGASYTFTVTATNTFGDGPASTPSSDVVPAGVPNAPTDVTATRGNGSVTIEFVEPNSNGDAIVGYTVTVQPGGEQIACTASPCDVEGLTNGAAYTFTVTATNSVGTSTASAPSAAVVPATVPDAPSDVSAIRGNTQATVSFTAPSSNGDPISGYTVTVQPSDRTVACSTSPCAITGLTNGTAYTFTVSATNAVGTGAASRASAAVTPATVPDAPMNVVAVAGDRQATVTFDAPTSNGGSPITGFVVTAACGDASCPVADLFSTFTESTDGTACESSPCVVDGLLNGATYTFSVVAVNDVGESEASAASPSVVPAGAPSAPLNPTVRQISGGVTVSWAAPTDVNGSPVTGYVVSGGGQTCETDARTTTCTFEGLSLGTVFTIAAQNAAGESVGVTAVPESPTGTLPSTGSDAMGSLVAMAFAALVLGAALLVQARRRRDVVAN